MDQVHVIRHKVLVEKVPARQVAREMGVSRNTVRRYVEGAPPGVRKAVARPRPVFDAVVGRMEQLLMRSSAWTGGKQRLTAMRLHEHLWECCSIFTSAGAVYFSSPLAFSPGCWCSVSFS